MYDTIIALREGKAINFEGIRLKMDGDGEVAAGDLYVAERNGPPKLLTCKSLNLELRCIHPTTMDYSFDIGECVKVREA